MVKEIVAYFYFNDDTPEVEIMQIMHNGWPMMRIPDPTTYGYLKVSDNPETTWLLVTNSTPPLKYTVHKTQSMTGGMWTVFSSLESNTVAKRPNPYANIWANHYIKTFSFGNDLSGKVLFIHRYPEK